MPVYAECCLLPRFRYIVKVKIVQLVGHHAILTYLKLHTLLTSLLDMGAWMAWCLAVTFLGEVIPFIVCSVSGWGSEQTEKYCSLLRGMHLTCTVWVESLNTQQLSVGKNMDPVKRVSHCHCVKCFCNKYNSVDKLRIRITQTLSWALMHFAL